MIDKLEYRSEVDKFGNCYGLISPSRNEIVDKINEIIDVINALRKERTTD